MCVCLVIAIDSVGVITVIVNSSTSDTSSTSSTSITNQSCYPNARGEETIAAEGALMSLRCRKKTNVSAMSQEDYSIIVITDTAYANLCRKP